MSKQYSCSICGSSDHNSRRHDVDVDASSRSVEAGRLVYEQELSFAEAGRRVGISRQAAHQGWRRYVQRRDLQKSLTFATKR
jgi:predicted DNA-binding protein (UPF0251 family)